MTSPSDCNYSQAHQPTAITTIPRSVFPDSSLSTLPQPFRERLERCLQIIESQNSLLLQSTQNCQTTLTDAEISRRKEEKKVLLNQEETIKELLKENLKAQFLQDNEERIRNSNVVAERLNRMQEDNQQLQLQNEHSQTAHTVILDDLRQQIREVQSLLLEGSFSSKIPYPLLQFTTLSTDKTLENLLSSFHVALSELTIHWIPLRDPQQRLFYFQEVVKRSPGVNSIHLNQMILPSEWELLTRSYGDKLLKISLENSGIEETVWAQSLIRFPNLTKLSIKKTAFTGSFLKSLGVLQQLQCLTLKINSAWSIQYELDWAPLQALKKLNLTLDQNALFNCSAIYTKNSNLEMFTFKNANTHALIDLIQADLSSLRKIVLKNSSNLESRHLAALLIEKKGLVMVLEIAEQARVASEMSYLISQIQFV